MTHVRTERVGSIGRIVLDRPGAINALTHDMVRRMTAVLRGWADDDSVDAVVLTGAGERGLCAGGDIRAIHDDVLDGGGTIPQFWRDEYHLDALIARYPKPFLAVMDGIVLGGGVGISAHASHRVVTERTRIALPETRIGLLPDVGSTLLLARAPGGLGVHAGLTGDRLGPGDALAMGLADRYLPVDRVPELLDALGEPSGVDGDAVGRLLDRFAEAGPEPELAGSRGWIDRCYAEPTVEAILDRLAGAGAPDAERAAATIGATSPTCAKVTLEALRRARRFTRVEQALDQEFRMSLRCLGTSDLVEGIRARVVDRTREPAWDPATLDRVDDERVAAYFAPLHGIPELGLSGQPAAASSSRSAGAARPSTRSESSANTIPSTPQSRTWAPTE